MCEHNPWELNKIPSKTSYEGGATHPQEYFNRRFIAGFNRLILLITEQAQARGAPKQGEGMNNALITLSTEVTPLEDKLEELTAEEAPVIIKEALPTLSETPLLDEEATIIKHLAKGATPKTKGDTGDLELFKDYTINMYYEDMLEDQDKPEAITRWGLRENPTLSDFEVLRAWTGANDPWNTKGVKASAAQNPYKTNPWRMCSHVINHWICPHESDTREQPIKRRRPNLRRPHQRPMPQRNGYRMTSYSGSPAIRTPRAHKHAPNADHARASKQRISDK